MLRAFYHNKDYKNATYSTIYENGTPISQIKSDMRCNNAVLDAVYNSKTNKVALYSRNLTKGDIYANLD